MRNFTSSQSLSRALRKLCRASAESLPSWCSRFFAFAATRSRRDGARVARRFPMWSSPRAHGFAAPSSVQTAKPRIMAVKCWPRTASTTAACATWRSNFGGLVQIPKSLRRQLQPSPPAVSADRTRPSRAPPRTVGQRLAIQRRTVPRPRRPAAAQNGSRAARAARRAVRALGRPPRRRHARSARCCSSDGLSVPPIISQNPFAAQHSPPQSSWRLRFRRRSLRLARAQMPAPAPALLSSRDPRRREKLQLQCRAGTSAPGSPLSAPAPTR